MVAVLVAMGTTRWLSALVSTFLWLTTLLVSLPDESAGPLIVANVVALLSPVVLAWWLALRTDGRRIIHPIFGCTVIAFFVLATAAFGPETPLLVFIVVPIVALFFAAFDPRLSATSAVLFAWVLLWLWARLATVPIGMVVVVPAIASSAIFVMAVLAANTSTRRLIQT